MFWQRWQRIMWPWQVFVLLVGVQSVEYFVTDRFLDGQMFQRWRTRLDKLSPGSSQQAPAKAGFSMKATLWFQAPMTMSPLCNAKHLGKVGCVDPTTSWRLPILFRMMLTYRSSLLWLYKCKIKNSYGWYSSIQQPCFWNSFVISFCRVVSVLSLNSFVLVYASLMHRRGILQPQCKL